MTLFWYIDETWRQDWTPFSITVLDLHQRDQRVLDSAWVRENALRFHGEVFHRIKEHVCLVVARK
jgi:hypothetical protein